MKNHTKHQLKIPNTRAAEASITKLFTDWDAVNLGKKQIFFPLRITKSYQLM